MTTFTSYASGWGGGSPATPTDTIIGPDGNLWGVCYDANIYKFDVTAHTTTTYPVAGSKQLLNLATDGTFIYAVDQNGTGGALPLVYKITTAGVSAALYSPGVFEDGGSVYFDGTYLWVTSSGAFRQLNLSGAVVNSYSGPAAYGGGLLNDGTYWWSGSNSSPNPNGVSRSPVGSPGTWTNVTTGFSGSATLPTAIASGLIWVGNQDANIYSITPPGAVTAYGVAAFQSFQLCFDGTDLWVATANGVLQTTTASPATGTYATGVPNATTILYDPATSTIWATGLTGVQPWTYSFALPNPSEVCLLC